MDAESVAEHDAQLYAAHDEIVADMPGPIRESYDQILLPLMADLGESPEAWRGAVRIGMEIMKGLSAESDEPIDELTQAQVNAARAQFVLILLIGLINTPWGRTALEANRNSGEARMRQMVDEVMRGMVGEVFE